MAAREGPRMTKPTLTKSKPTPTFTPERAQTAREQLAAGKQARADLATTEPTTATPTPTPTTSSQFPTRTHLLYGGAAIVVVAALWFAFKDD